MYRDANVKGGYKIHITQAKREREKRREKREKRDHHSTIG